MPRAACAAVTAGDDIVTKPSYWSVASMASQGLHVLWAIAQIHHELIIQILKILYTLVMILMI